MSPVLPATTTLVASLFVLRAPMGAPISQLIVRPGGWPVDNVKWTLKAIQCVEGRCQKPLSPVPVLRRPVEDLFWYLHVDDIFDMPCWPAPSSVGGYIAGFRRLQIL